MSVHHDISELRRAFDQTIIEGLRRESERDEKKRGGGGGRGERQRERERGGEERDRYRVMKISR